MCDLDKNEVNRREVYFFIIKSKTEESTCFGYTGLFGELEQIKIETRLTDERFANISLSDSNF